VSTTPGDFVAQHPASRLTQTTNELERMLRAGLALIPIPSGRKGPAFPAWNTRSACITDPLRAGELVGQNAGLAHAYSGTCALDVDDFQAAHGC
jgi:Bifunctional DNA primase/polymerase, N-terminal